MGDAPAKATSLPWSSSITRIIRIGLASIGHDHGFALAGGYAVHAHDITQRLSQDIDLFTSWETPRRACRCSRSALHAALQADGLSVEIAQQHPASRPFERPDRESGATTTVHPAASKTECLFTRIPIAFEADACA